jgi:single-strand DNA-binding protein
MPSYNRVLLMGNLTGNPELKYTPSGTAVADLGLAVNESFKNKAGELVERTCFVDVVVWSRQAETAAEYLHKGSPVFVEGRLQLDQWENQQGEKRSKLRVRADRVQFLGSPEGSRGAESSAAPAAAPVAQPVAPPPAAPAPEADDDDDVPF